MNKVDYFLKIYGALPRAGPGSYECTRRAYEMMAGLPKSPHILDIGCGPGVQTVDLLKMSNGTVLALDSLALMINRTKANAERARVVERLAVLEQDMQQMDFAPASFDVIWSEGALYNIGFESGLRKVWDFVRPGGFVAVSEVVWLKSDPPDRLMQYWSQYPEIETVDSKLVVLERLGYTTAGHFIFPESAWRMEYYDPMENLVVEKSKEWDNNPQALEVLDEARHEIEIFREFSNYFGYAFFVMSRPRE